MGGVCNSQTNTSAIGIHPPGRDGIHPRRAETSPSRPRLGSASRRSLINSHHRRVVSAISPRGIAPLLRDLLSKVGTCLLCRAGTRVHPLSLTPTDRRGGGGIYCWSRPGLPRGPVHSPPPPDNHRRLSTTAGQSSGVHCDRYTAGGVWGRGRGELVLHQPPDWCMWCGVVRVRAGRHRGASNALMGL